MYKNYNTSHNHITRLINMFVDTIPHDIIETSCISNPAVLMKMVLCIFDSSFWLRTMMRLDHC